MVINDPSRRVVIYSGNMLNDIPDEDVITMEMVETPKPLCVEVSEKQWVRYTWLDHFPKEDLGEIVGEIPDELMSTVNNRLFMVIATN